MVFFTDYKNTINFRPLKAFTLNFISYGKFVSELNNFLYLNAFEAAISWNLKNLS